MIVVTGAAGFIGSAVTAALRKRGESVLGVDIRSSLDVGYADLRDYSDVLAALDGAERVIHLAADMGGVGYFHTYDYTPYLNNMTIDMNVFRACEELGIARLFYAASACVYPTQMQQNAEYPPKLNEAMIYPANADQSYGWEKLMGLRLAERAPFDARVGILHTVYGPGQEWTGPRAKFPPSIAGKAVKARREGGPIEIWGDGAQRRSYCYIDDAVAKILAIVDAKDYDGPVNVGAEGAVSCTEIAHLAAEIAGLGSWQFTHNHAKPSGVLGRDCDNAKFRRVYGFDNEVGLRTGFTKLIDWINQAWTAAA